MASDPSKYGAMSLIGVVSWGYGCAGVDALGIYAEVSHFNDWLSQQMPDLSTCPPYAGGALPPSPSPSPSPPSPSPSPSSSTSSPSPTAGECCSGCLCSPNYPSNYDNNLDMEYVMTAAAGETVTITFTAFDVEFHSTCNYDWVEIYDGSGTLLLNKTCGTTIPGVVTSTSNTATLYFHTDRSVIRSGFEAQLSSGVTFTSAASSSTPSPPSPISECCSGCLCTPNYPYNYENNLDVEYVMTASAGQSITITFNTFQLEYSSSCAFDWVEIYEGSGTSGSVILPKACGTEAPGTVTIASGTATLLFHTDRSVTFSGFEAQLSDGVTFTNTTISGSTQSPSPTPTPSPSPVSTSSPSSNTTGSCGSCVFPFIYAGRIHDRCTSIDGDAPWCSTAVDSSGVHISGQNLWEYCTDPACPGLAANPAEAMQPHPQNEANPNVCCKYKY